MQSEPNPNPDESRNNPQPDPAPGAPTSPGGDTFDVFYGGARRRVVADRLALSLYYQVRDLSVADRQLVFRALVTRTAARASTPRANHASSALAACCADHGHRGVSRREYDEWRSGLTSTDGGEPSGPTTTANATTAAPATGADTSALGAREVPSSSFIRKVFPSWTAVLAALGYEGTGDGRARSLRRHSGRGGRREEMVAALRALAPQDGAPLTIRRYQEAARAHNDTQAPDGQRFPLRAHAFRMEFGSWAKALAAAGLPCHPHAQALADHVSRDAGLSSQARQSSGGGRVRVGRPQDYSTERMRELLQRAARELNVSHLSTTQFDEWARATSAAAAGDGQALVIPNSNTLVRRHGRWKTALFDAGLLTAEESVREGSGGVYRYSDEELLDALREAMAALEGRPTMKAYASWRRAHITGNDACKLPGTVLFAKRFGAWTRAVALAAQGNPADRGGTP